MRQWKENKLGKQNGVTGSRGIAPGRLKLTCQWMCVWLTPIREASQWVAPHVARSAASRTPPETWRRRASRWWGCRPSWCTWADGWSTWGCSSLPVPAPGSARPTWRSARWWRSALASGRWRRGRRYPPASWPPACATGEWTWRPRPRSGHMHNRTMLKRYCRALET